jgi:hydroxymethylglutaryl-CoA reductase
MKNRNFKEFSKGFSKLSLGGREHRLIENGFLTNEDFSILKNEGSLPLSLANQLIENVIGTFPLPLGIALNFVINGRDYLIPMVVEETSIIAAASKTARWIQEEGELTTQSLGQLGVGQIQLPKVKDIEQLKLKIETKKKDLIDFCNKGITAGLVSRGGGVTDIIVRNLSRPDGGYMAVIHVLVNTCDAMGANIINQICEFLKIPIEELVHEKVAMCVLSNLTDTKLTQAKVVIRNISPQLGEAIIEASLFAQLDPFRAATNNKGILNGIDAVLIATGNDWRAVEAGLHAYAAHSGRYTSLTRWFMEGPHLHGEMIAPILVGIVGGMTRLHPVAQICLRLLNVKSGSELAQVIAAVGLVQNLAAMRALVTQGITKGHMKLHLSNLALAVGAIEEEMSILKQRLKEHLEVSKHVTESDARTILAEIRKNHIRGSK